MREKDIEVARALKAKLSAAVGLLDFKVFGSRARGDADEYSDLDVFIELETLDSEVKQKISDIAWEVGFQNGVVIMPLVFSRYEIEDSPLRSSAIVRSIAAEGVAV
jgi:predicted nucleotidyltransferase